MEKNRVYDLKEYSPKGMDVFFFDANVWIYIFFPRGNIKRAVQSAYADFFAKINSRKLPIHINSLILSELSNAYMNDSYKIWQAQQTDLAKTDKKKHFRPSEEYKEALSEIKGIIEKILKYITRSSDEFNSISMLDVLEEHNTKEFNDSYYIVLANQKKLKIVTHDADIFKGNNLGVEVITANI